MSSHSHMKHAREVLSKVFGYHDFRDNQAAIIEDVLNNHSPLVLMPTGGGKSLCYQIPSIVKPGVGIIITPLIALMEDQVSALQTLGVKAAALNSGMSGEASGQVIRALRNNELDVLYIAPERLFSGHTIELFHEINIALFAIDEAHCLSQWGHDFRKDYLQLGEISRLFPGVPRIALTATADEQTRAEIQDKLALDAVYVSSFDRPNIHYSIEFESGNANARLLRFIEEEHQGECGIVYCSSRKGVDATAEFLAEQGIKALPYHAGMDSESRSHHQSRFLKEDGVVMVATVAFGMGINKPDVRFVAHMNMPKTIESYYQETGRAGRDGLPSVAWMLYKLGDIHTNRRFIEQAESSDLFKSIQRQKLDAMVALCETTRCRRELLLDYFGERQNEKCGHCDVCDSPPEQYDGTLYAQYALSAIYRTEQKFGVNHVIDVLLGSKAEKVLRFGHDKTSTYGLGKDLSSDEWKGIFRQLIVNKLVTVDHDHYNVLRLTDAARPVLRGEQPITFRKQSMKKKSRKSRGGNQQHSALFESIKDYRKKMADEQGVPAYVIFHDATIASICAVQPTTMAELHQVEGFGEKRIEKFGTDILELLKQHRASQADDGDTYSQTLQLLRAGKSVEAIAEERQLSVGTVYGHLARLIGEQQLRFDEVFTLATDEKKALVDTITLLGDELKLRDVFESFDGQYSYDLIKCLIAEYRAGS